MIYIYDILLIFYDYSYIDQRDTVWPSCDLVGVGMMVRCQAVDGCDHWNVCHVMPDWVEKHGCTVCVAVRMWWYCPVRRLFLHVLKFDLVLKPTCTRDVLIITDALPAIRTADSRSLKLLSKYRPERSPLPRCAKVDTGWTSLFQFGLWKVKPVKLEINMEIKEMCKTSQENQISQDRDTMTKAGRCRNQSFKGRNPDKLRCQRSPRSELSKLCVVSKEAARLCFNML